MDEIEPYIKELMLMGITTTASAYTGMFWIFVLGTLVTVGLWAYSRKTNKIKRAYREAKRYRVEWDRRVRKA
jgi:O-antigen/teichoic acid export membrane protein